ncbi:unnamed protein product [Urochloa humidicola]
MATRAAATAAACHRAVRDKLGAVASQPKMLCSQLRSYYCFLGGTTSAALVAALAALLCAAAAYPRAAASLLPLAATTTLCCAVAGLFAAEERGAGAGAGGHAVEAVVRVGGRGQQGNKAEAGLVQVIGEANASSYGGGASGVQVGCFLRKSERFGVDEDGEEVVFAGTLSARCVAGAGDGAGGDEGVAAGVLWRVGHGALEEEVAAMRVDKLAEGVWNSYFGGWSRWHDVDAGV